MKSLSICFWLFNWRDICSPHYWSV